MINIVEDEVASLDRLMVVIRLREGQQWPLHNIKTAECIYDIVKDIASEKVVGFGNGLFKEEGSTAA